MTSTANETGNARSAQTPQFLNKLSAMVDDPTTDRFIKWSDDGTSFYVFNPDQFAKELLGTYYKTDASASFVRQLNMYGFHKVPHVRQGALKSDKQAQAWHYRNPNFRRGRPDLLPYITRKGKAVGVGAGSHAQTLALQSIKPDLDNDLELLSGPLENNNNNSTSDSLSRTGSGELAKGSPKNIDMSQIINGLATIKRHQMLISDNLKELQGSNQALWQEAMEARERHRKHQETINRILKFLASLFQGSATTPIRSASMSSAQSPNEAPGPVHGRARLMIKDVPDGEEDNDDVTSTPRSSVRMEEVHDDETSAPSATIETPQTPTTDKPTPIPTASSHPQAATASQYPFMEQGYLANGMYIPPADAWKMLQWLQQNHIPIPGVSYPADANAGALTTMTPNAAALNQLAFSNALAEMNGSVTNFNAGSQAQVGQMGNNNNNNNASAWPTATYGPPIMSNQQQQQQPDALGSMYQQNQNQFLNSLLPLASMANERPPDINIAQVSNNGDKLGQLSTHVEAMEQGIDSLIQGMGLDPLSAASLRAQQDANAAKSLPNSAFSMDPDPNNQQQHGMGSITNGLNNMSHQDGFSTGMDPYQSAPSDFDLDELLKHLGVAAAASTPPALHAIEGFPELNMNGDQSGFDSHLNNPFDPNLFNDVNLGMYTQNPDPSQFYGMGDTGASQNQNQNQTSGQASSGFLDEINSPVTVRDGSVDLTKDIDASAASSAGRGRAKKRKQDSSRDDSLSQEGGTLAPIRAQSKGTARASKRRK